MADAASNVWTQVIGAASIKPPFHCSGRKIDIDANSVATINAIEKPVCRLASTQQTSAADNRTAVTIQGAMVPSVESGSTARIMAIDAATDTHNVVA